MFALDDSMLRPYQEEIEINGKKFIIEHIDGIWYCSILPGRFSRAALIDDIKKAQGPEWRHKDETK